MNNISEIYNCYGCGVCAISCPKDAITIKLNKSGFLQPSVDLDICVNCGLCLRVCSFHNDAEEASSDLKSYEAWTNNKQIREEASSGGIGYEIAKYCYQKKYQTVLVKYNIQEERAEHYIVKEGFLDNSLGSKYIQSYTVDALRQIDFKRNILFVGTPCQVASLRRFARQRKKEDKFLFVDFFCHGVPSDLAWKNYLMLYREQTGKLSYVSWRDKDNGWQDSWAMFLKGERGTIHSRRSDGDLFYSIFLGGWCMNPACRKKCKFKYKKSSADIRIGDLWGSKYESNDEGVSACVAFTDKGEKIVQSLESCTKIPSTFDIVAQGQMKKNAKGAWLSSLVMKKLQNNCFLSQKEWSFYFRLEFYLHVPYLIFMKLRNLLKI